MKTSVVYYFNFHFFKIWIDPDNLLSRLIKRGAQNCVSCSVGTCTSCMWFAVTSIIQHKIYRGAV